MERRLSLSLSLSLLQILRSFAGVRGGGSGTARRGLYIFFTLSREAKIGAGVMAARWKLGGAVYIASEKGYMDASIDPS